MILPSANGHSRIGAPGEKTDPQVMVTIMPDGVMPAVNDSGWAKKVRQMRRDPTISFVRKLYLASILAGDWNVVSENPKYEDAVPLVKACTLPFRDQFLQDSVRGLMDFGWQPFEVVKQLSLDGTLVTTKIKSLLQDLSQVLVDQHGALIGVRNVSTPSGIGTFGGGFLDLYASDAIVMYREVEGTYWYGEPIMRSVEAPYDASLTNEDSAQRFSKKLAGAHWVIYFPVGTSKDETGEEVDNYTLANRMATALKASSIIAVPNSVQKQIDDLNDVAEDKRGWKIELISAQSNQADFVDRAKYLDALKVRGFGFPERAILEGQFGTKAEAEAHADFAIDVLENAHKDIVRLFNRQHVNVVLRLNYGTGYEDRVKVSVAPLSDVKRAFLRQLYLQLFSSTEGLAEEVDRIDLDAVRKDLSIPVRQEISPPKEEPVA